MLNLKKGSDVFSTSGKQSTDYEKCLLFLAREIRSMLRWQYYATRYLAKLPIFEKFRKKPDSVDEFQLRETIAVLHISIATNLRKLLETNRGSWNFARLFQSIKKQVSPENAAELSKAVEYFRNNWAEIKEYGDTIGSHIDKSRDPEVLPLPVNLEHILVDAVNLLDRFCGGEVIYEIQTKEQVVDLRKFITEWAAQAPRIGRNTPRQYEIKAE